ncbi:MAG: 2-C-methyl-D-erythritol 4-phosphate cytidylyltransferase [Burkholderiales bacterium]|nr:2-C-methyl-D-erythritol 4-phosphate cytidylyltransferase [Burkholderiales bacterium]
MQGGHFGAEDAQGYNSSFCPSGPDARRVGPAVATLSQGIPIASDARWLALIPAAGVGARLGAALPKQYLELAGRTMLEWSVEAMLAVPWIERVLVVVSPADARAAALLGGRERVEVHGAGGATRAETVGAGLRRLAGGGARPHDWVLVHDAARPGLEPAMLERLRGELGDSPVGGLLAVPVGDTVKHSDDGHDDGRRHAQATLARERLWLAQTPQMFRFGLLAEALASHPEVTDEAAALERAGHAPRLVEGGRANFKVTTMEDLEWMRWLLERRAAQRR